MESRGFGGVSVSLARPKLASSLLVALLLSVAGVGCANSPKKPPESALKQAKKDDGTLREHEFDPERRHVAPPPAYGNKVVMAQGAADKSGQF